MFVKPREGLIVRDPVHRRPLPADGAEVPEIQFWHQRLIEGDVVLVNREPVPSREA